MKHSFGTGKVLFKSKGFDAAEKKHSTGMAKHNALMKRIKNVKAYGEK